MNLDELEITRDTEKYLSKRNIIISMFITTPTNWLMIDLHYNKQLTITQQYHQPIFLTLQSVRNNCTTVSTNSTLECLY